MSIAKQVADTLSHSDVLLCAEPGAGKSTGLPLALLSHAPLKGHIFLLEPRRLAARLVAARLAEHLGEKIGQRIGLRMRGETRVSSSTQLTVVTEGVLTRLIQDDPELSGVSVVIFDEFHERSLHADLGLALCLDIQQALREDLRLLLMSATLDASALAQQLNHTVEFTCSVRQHPVDIVWCGSDSTQTLETQVSTVVRRALEQYPGDVLVFLPGVAEIRRCHRSLHQHLGATVQLHELHSGVAKAAQARATAAASREQRRVILATSLAETSITIDGVSIVVDAGLERRGRIDTATGAQRLETVMASQASATQRAGRAGRTSAGVCLRLWHESGHTRRATHWQPEILRADLTPLAMELAQWGATHAEDLRWLDPPPEANLARAQTLLTTLGLLHDGRLTRKGRQVAKLPVHPRLACMLVWAHEVGATAMACRLASVLDESSRLDRETDLDTLMQMPASPLQQRRAEQLQGMLGPAVTTPRSISVAVLLAMAYPDRIAQRRPGSAANYRLSGGAGVTIENENSLAQAPWLAVAELGGSGAQLRIFKAAALDIQDLQHHAPELFDTRKHIDWDSRQQRVVAEERRMVGQLVVHSRSITQLSKEDRVASLLVGIRQQGPDCLPWTEACREWQARVERMRELQSNAETSAWPKVDDDTLMATLDQWLAPWLHDIGSLKALQQLKLQPVLDALLDYPQQLMLNEYLPTRYTVPSGSKIALSYVQPGPPVLSVRLQEMLGCRVNPSIAQGRIILKVELLSPAHRPIQVTADLVNFWTSSYPDVKKDMAGRYPKHLWPDDPINTQATKYTRHRRTRA